MANQIIDAGREVFPDWEFSESLAGVGHKTAGVVMSQAFGIPAFPVDTHIHRLASRWGLSNGKSIDKTERDLKSVLRRKLGIKASSNYFFRKEYWHLDMIWKGVPFVHGQQVKEN